MLGLHIDGLKELFGINANVPQVSIFNIIGCIAVSFAFGPRLAAAAFFVAFPFLFRIPYSRVHYKIKLEELNRGHPRLLGRDVAI
ncbi:hypothetical protein EYZ11_006684 [Aspergillus tanneri]|uniref:Uncharacterized protein n=1 Tax=Aspergillus tanneri TaxID=1220188 RepID=A0A4S3JF51_9EURO|nr:hypothetical protein EYZ11_006684 [Aspergillus tanneri]